jgi:hypothetical protein
MIKQLRRIASISAMGAFVVATPALAGTGPSSSQTPYVVPLLPTVDVTSILTVGDAAGGYQMIGIPDGLGAIDNGDGTFNVYMNHELGKTAGTIVRDHGQIGSFVSQWTIDSSTLQVVAGDDQIQNLNLSDIQASDLSGGTSASQMGRLCSADLPAESAFFNAATGLGTSERIFMDGEEIGNEGRAFAHIVTGANDGQSYQLPRLGRFSWENSVAAPSSSDTTVVMGTDDTTPGQVYVYVGTKTNAGSEIDRAGLTNGSLYGIRVGGGAPADETRGTALGAAKGVALPFDLFDHGNQTGLTGTALQAASEAAVAPVTEFLRPEDGAFDPNNPNDFYFVTTDRFSNPGPGNEGRSRLWRITFSDISNPTLGGDVTMLLDGTEGQNMLDNITVDSHGNVLMQEDPGNQNHLARIWGYSTTADRLVLLAQHDPDRFAPGAPGFLTRDEESSGITPVTDILDPTGATGREYALFDVQAHYNNGTTLVEGGQLLVLSYDASQVPEPGTVLLLGAGLAGIALRRRS